MLTVPRLQHEIRQLSRVAAECQRNDMVEFKVRHPRCIKPGFPEQLGLYCVGVAARWSNRLCIARNTDRLPDCFLGNVWVQRDAAVRGLNAGSILRDVGRRILAGRAPSLARRLAELAGGRTPDELSTCAPGCKKVARIRQRTRRQILEVMTKHNASTLGFSRCYEGNIGPNRGWCTNSCLLDEDAAFI